MASNHIDQITAILKGEQSEPEPQGETEQDPGDPGPELEPGGSEEETRAGDEDESEESEAEQGEPLAIKDLAEKLGTSPKALYENIRIPVDGELLSLSEIKDLAAQAKPQQAELEGIRETWDAQERQLMTQRQELAAIMQVLGPRLDPQSEQQVLEYMANTEAQEAHLLKLALPRWQNPTIRQTELMAIAELGKQYGLQGRELEYMIRDHRLVKLLRDVAVGRTKITESREARQDSSARPSQRSNAAREGLRELERKAKRPDAKRTDKLRAIGALLTQS
jgi:hypothetical protein